MARYSDTLRDALTQAPIEGALVSVLVNGTDGTAALTDDNGHAMDNPLLTDVFGSVVFNAAPDFYDLEYHYGGRMARKDYNVPVLAGGGSGPSDTLIGFDENGNIEFIPIEDFKGDPGGNVMAIGLFTGASSLSIPTGTNLVQTSGWRTTAIGAGLYVADAVVNAAFVTANPTWSFISSNGRGFRLYDEQRLTIEMFSAWGDATLSITGTDDNPAFLAAMAYQDVYRYAPSGNTDYKPTPSIWLKRRGYRNSAQLNFAKSGYDFRGEGNNFNGYGGAAIFMDAGQGGCIFQCWDSSGNSLAGTHTPHPYGTDPRGAQNSRLENITFSSRGGTVGDTTQNGVLIHTQISMRGVHAFHFGGHGIAIVADVGNGTNANATSLEDCGGSYSGISGYFDSGGDVNAGRNIGFQAFNNNAFGIHAGNFLGQFYLYFQVDGNGYGGSCGPSWGGAANSAGSGATQAGNHYRVIPGQEVGARTNAPSGTTASNTWWSWIEAGAASTLYPAWVSGHKYMAGGAFFAGGGDYGVNNNARNVFAGYAEGNQLGGLSFSNTSCCLPGFAGWSGAYLNVSSGAMVSPKIGAIKPGSVAGYQLGALLGSSTADDIYMTLGNSNAGTMNWTFTADNTDVLSAQWLGAGGSQPYFLLPGTTTPGVQFYRGIKIFNSVHYSGTAPPTTGTWVLGTVMWNETPAAAGPPGWVCTTAGTPGTWKAMANLAA